MLQSGPALICRSMNPDYCYYVPQLILHQVTAASTKIFHFWIQTIAKLGIYVDVDISSTNGYRLPESIDQTTDIAINNRSIKY